MKDQDKGPTALCVSVFAIFLALKLTGVIGWSWWWVTSPLWIPCALAIVGMLFCCFLALFAEGYEEGKDK